jgi:hypothetical protein
MRIRAALTDSTTPSQASAICATEAGTSIGTLDSNRRRLKSINSRQLEVGAWNGQMYQWPDRSLNVRVALATAHPPQA